jgi:hypothetical protein
MHEVIIPALEALELKYEQREEHALLGFVGETGHLDLVIRPVERPPLIWLHFRPHFFALGSSREVLLEADLGINARTWLVKCGYERQDGEIIIDAEYPMLDETASVQAFAAFLVASQLAAFEATEVLARARWSGLRASDQPQATMGKAEPAALEMELPQLTPRVEEELEALLRRLNEPGAV